MTIKPETNFPSETKIKYKNLKPRQFRSPRQITHGSEI